MAEADKGAYGDFWYPDVKAGAQGIKWIEKCVESANNGSSWVVYGICAIERVAREKCWGSRFFRFYS